MLFNRQKVAKSILMHVEARGFCIMIPGQGGYPKLNGKNLEKLQGALPDDLTGIAWLDATVNRISAMVFSFNALLAWNTYVEVIMCSIGNAEEWDNWCKSEQVLGMRAALEKEKGIILPPMPEWKPT
jgi:hypothetical protein